MKTSRPMTIPRGTRKYSPYTEKDLSDLFFKGGCTYLGRDPTNKKKCSYICSCGEKSSITPGNFRWGNRCGICGDKKKNLSRTKKQTEVANEFCKMGVILLGEYVNSATKVDCLCSCGAPIKVARNQILAGVKCRKCGWKKTSEKLSGSKSYRYKGHTEEEKILRRRFWLRKWKKAVHFKYPKCVKCSATGPLEAHHILPYDSFPEIRGCLDNGVTLCKPCHISYHSLYLKKENAETLLEYVGISSKWKYMASSEIKKSVNSYVSGRKI